MNPSMKRYLILAISIIIFITLLGLIIYKLKVNSTSDNNNVENKITFKIQRGSIDARNPYLNSYLNFSTSIADNNTIIKNIDPGLAEISTSDFTIVVFNSGEGNPANGTISSDNISLSNNGKELFRVNYSDDKDMSAYLKSLNLNFNYRFFYTDQYNEGCNGQLPNGFCGTDFINIQPDPNGNKVGYQLYCLLNDKKFLNKCDQFVSNLKITKS